MNYSDIKDSVYNYLSYRQIQKRDELDELIEKHLADIDLLNTFKAQYAEFDHLPYFAENEPYRTFLSGSNGMLLIACTLGAEIDRQIKKYSLTDMREMIIYDACANAYLEYKCEEFKQGLGKDLSYIFCPGYQGSSLEDIKLLFERLKPEKIGLTLTESFMMLPQKSIIGIIAKGVNPQKKCGNCTRINNCVYRKVGKLCYN